MANRDITLDASNPNKATPIGADKLTMIDTETDPDTLKEVLLADLLKNYLPIYTPYKIVPSVSSNNLTVAIKRVNGSDADANNPLKFRVGDTEYTLTASASFTKNAGTNWCNAGGAELATKNIDFFMYAIGETGAAAGLKFGFSRIPFATTMADFVNTTTNEKYIAGNWTNFTSTDVVVLIGRFRAQLSASASFNWSIPSALVLNYPVDKTDVLDWVVTSVTASGGGTFTSPTFTLLKYQIEGRWLNVEAHYSGTVTGTVTGVSINAPFESLRIGSALPIGPAKVSGGLLGNAEMGAGTPDTLGCSKYDVSAFTTGASVVKFFGRYEI